MMNISKVSFGEDEVPEVLYHVLDENPQLELRARIDRNHELERGSGAKT